MKPWALARSDRERLGTVLTTLAEVIKTISVLIWPFMPQTAEKIQHQLGLERVGSELPLETPGEWGRTKQVKAISKAPPLFPRVNPEGEKGRG